MKVLLFLLLAGIACADLPRLTIEHGGSRQDLRVDEVEVTVRVEGDLVETRMSLVFFNETYSNQEGEFRFPLPEGASVNHYALEVEGRMREATVVEKEQARRAYETIKARNIDPGLVEKMEGNIYRTRIFPVLPQQGKRVSIGYVQAMEKVGDEMVYRLPFGVEEKIGKFQLKIEGELAGVSPKLSSGAVLEEDGEGYSFVSEHAPVGGDLVLKRKAAIGGFSGEIREVDGKNFAYLTGVVPQEFFDQKVRKPESLTVIWDASAGGYARDLDAEVEFLGALVEELGEVTVRLMAVHGELEDLGEFQVKGGDWESLRAAVEGIFHDGAADWRTVDFPNLAGGRVLLFGGNESAFPIKRVRAGGVFQVIRSGAGAVDKVLADMAEKSGGGVVDLANLEVAVAVTEVLEPGLRVVGMSGAVESYFSEIVDGQVRIFAKMKNGDAGEVLVSFARGAEDGQAVRVSLELAEGGNASRYLWAQRKLEELVRSRSLITGEEKSAIIEHCQNYGLVSDFTSLIVLERMEDHIEFRIPPPEPELMAAYEKGLKESMARMKSGVQVEHIAAAWKQRIRWHWTDFPWMDVALLPRYARVKKWTDAQTSVFEKEQLAQTNVAEFLAWRKDAEKVILRRNKITGKKEFTDWAARIDELLESGKALGAKDAALPEKGEFAVSVRGLVQEPQTLSLKNGSTLREAVEKAGGIHSAGTESRVALYRSGKRSVYNLLSDKYEDVKLLPGDMVVAMSRGYDSSSDPFAEFSPSPKDHGAEPALVEGDLPLDSSMSRFNQGGDPFGSGASAPGDLPSLKGEMKEVETRVADRKTLDKMLKATDSWSAYRSGRAEMGDDLAGFAMIAGALYERNEIGKARRVLANVYGRRGFHVPSLRAAAYWMMQFKDYQGAGEIFELIATEFPDDALLGFDLMRLKRMADAEKADAGLRESSLTDIGRAMANSSNIAVTVMAMMERNRFEAVHNTELTRHLPRDREVFPSDIRIVVSSSHPEETYLKVTEPTGQTVDYNRISSTGGRMTSGDGVAEFMIRRAMPGDYSIELANLSQASFQVEVFINWGKENETRRMFTRSGDGEGRLMNAGVVKFELAEP